CQQQSWRWKLWQHVPLRFALGLGIDNIVLDGDSDTHIKTLQIGNTSLAQYPQYRDIANDIHYLPAHLLAFTNSNVHKHCNKIAHSLAQR
ncbi:hypothetical protein SO802_022119, partial [Lithocarpus litseifolius]